MQRKAARNFGVLQLGGGYGLAKRLLRESNKFDTKTEKHRRGPLNGLIPGGAFGRAARNEDCVRSNCQRFGPDDRFIKLLKTPVQFRQREEMYSTFDGENRNDSDSQEKPTDTDIYTPYQYKQFLGLE